MAHVTENDFKKMAEAIANDLVNGKVPLNESVAKLASSMDLNQEQIRRLCETTNNTTFNQLFQAKDKTASDRMVEFDVADPDKILGSLIKSASAVETSTDTMLYLSELRSLRDDVQPLQEETTKTASVFQLRPESAPKREVDQRTLRKTLDHLRSEKLATELVLMDSVGELRKQFRRLYRDMSFEDFEKNAAALYGPAAEPILGSLRTTLKMPVVTYNYSVLQKNAGFIDDSSIEFKLMADAVATAGKLSTISAGIQKLETLV